MIAFSLLPTSRQPPFKPSIPSPLKLPSSVNHEFRVLKHRLIRLTEIGYIGEAISTLDLMTHHGITPDLLCYSIILKSCIKSRQFHRGKLVHAMLNRSHFQLDPVVQNMLISLYSKSGDWVTASDIFHSMGDQKTRVSWSSMISCFATNSMESQAIVTFIDMLECSLCFPNEYTFAAVIRACSNEENILVGEVTFGLALKNGYLGSNVCVGCALIDMFVKGSGDLECARKVFSQMPEKNLVAWTLMITRLTQLGQPRESIELFYEMGLNGHVADGYTFSAAISANTELGSSSFGKQLHSQVVRSGLGSDVCVGTSLVDMYSKCLPIVHLEDARKVFDEMTDHNVISWTAIITACAQSGGHDKEALHLFREMIITGHVLPNHFTFAAVLKACGNISNHIMGDQIYSIAVKIGFGSDTCVGNSLISMHAKGGRMEDAHQAFNLLFEKNLVSYNAMIDGYAKNSSSEKAFELFNEIEDRAGIQIGFNAFTFTSLLSGAASLGAVTKGEQIHCRILKLGFNLNPCISNALISMYSRCGNLESASAVFDEMGSQRNLVSWTSIITAFAKHGSAIRALEMFHKMIKTGINPNSITFIAVLSACSHAGMVSEGWNYFNSMQEHHKITPRMKHYACMVDLLCRRGFLHEAFDFINSIPIKPDDSDSSSSLLWRTLLSACRVHGNSKLGEHAARMIMKLDPTDPSAYILLSNLHASTGQWEDVASIRRSMNEMNLIKEAGCSWMEVGSRVYKFFVGDTLHPRASEIYEELERLVRRIKEMGYVPDTGFVLHDVEEERKEAFLLQHSEKIAVAFGIISTSSSKPIRIFKNLRVCGDCHTAIKYISLATGRQIVIRDSNRFHHMKNGACSCNDYW